MDGPSVVGTRVQAQAAVKGQCPAGNSFNGRRCFVVDDVTGPQIAQSRLQLGHEFQIVSLKDYGCLELWLQNIKRVVSMLV